jgi:hypothetical protein
VVKHDPQARRFSGSDARNLLIFVSLAYRAMSFRGGLPRARALGRIICWAGRPVCRVGFVLWSDIQCFVLWCVKCAPDRGPAARAHSRFVRASAWLVPPLCARLPAPAGRDRQ